MPTQCSDYALRGWSNAYWQKGEEDMFKCSDSMMMCKTKYIKCIPAPRNYDFMFFFSIDHVTSYRHFEVGRLVLVGGWRPIQTMVMFAQIGDCQDYIKHKLQPPGFCQTKASTAKITSSISFNCQDQIEYKL